MDMNYLVQRRINARKKYRRKVAITIALSAVLLILILVGLVKVIVDEKKSEENSGVTKNAASVTSGIPTGAANNAVEENNGNGESGRTEQEEQPDSASASPTLTPTPTLTSTPTATPTPTPAPKKTVALDAGHGGDDLGSTRQGLYEKDANLAIVFFLKEELENAGYGVYLVRSDDTYVENEDRPVQAIENGADLYVSIHLNSIEGDSDATQGAEVWYMKKRDDNKTLAQYIIDELVAVTGTRNRGVKVPDRGLIVLRQSDIPACLVECGFITSGPEREKLFDPEYQKKIAEGICNGIQKFLPVE